MNKKTILIIIGIILIVITALVFISSNEAEPINKSLNKCGDGICDAKEKANLELCPEDCKLTDNRTETCGQDNNGYCIDFREECKTGYEDIGPDTCRRGRSAGCCVSVESLAKKTCAEQNGTICSSSQTCSGSWLDASDSERCCDGVCENSEVNYADSPFGISIAGFLSNQDYKKSLQYMNEAGADTVRFMSKWGGLNWERIEPQKGVFDWSKTDEYYSEAIKNNLDIMVNIYPDNPEWDDPNNPYTMSVPVDMEAYLNFIKKTAERYPEITSWILGVELERGEEKKWWAGTPEEYADLFVKTSQTIKSVNPDAVVMTYGTNVYLNRKRGVIDTFTKPVLAEIKRLTKDSDDFSFFYAIHYYKTQDIALYIDILSYTQSMLDKYGFAEIPIIMTDMAPFFWNDEDLREQKLAKHLIKTYTVSFAHDLSNIVWAQLSDGYGYADGEQFEAGLITRDSQQPEGYYKNLGFYTYKLMVEKLEGSDWDNIQTIQESDNIYIYKFIKNNEPIWVAWWDYFDDSGTSKTITLDVGDMDAVKITEAVPDAEDGSKIDESDYPNFFKTEAKTTSGGRVEITLEESPVFVEEIKGGEPEEKTCSELNGTICSSSQTCSGSWLDASDSGWCCDGVCKNSEVDYEDSPFGFHPGNANNYIYTQDMGAVWSREGTYIIWDWVDVNRNGNFKFTDATAPPKKGVPGSGGQVNYDKLRLNTPENINIMTNVCPFRQDEEFANSQEKDTYYDFVKKMVERYDGDSDLGCTLTSPDCYNLGDNDYPSEEIIEKFRKNPIKYWQVCNQVTDICEGKDCRETYAKKYAEVQEITYKAVKEADSSSYVLIAGDSGKDLYPTVFEYLNGNYIDIIDLHRFGVEDTYNPKKDFDYLKTNLQSSGFDLADLRFWITETGTYSGDPIPIIRGDTVIDLPYQSEKNQASGLLKRYVSALSYKIEKIFWAWNIVEGFKRDCGIFDFTGLVYDGCDCDENKKYVCEKGIGYDLGKGVKKLSYYTYKLMVEKLEGSDWNNIQTIQESDNVYIYKFMKNGETVWVAWWDYFEDSETSKTITLAVGYMDAVKITEAVPDAEDGSKIDENDYPNFFKTEAKTTSGGRVEITLGESPVFVEEIKGGEPEEKTCSELNGTICSSSQTCSGSWLDASDSGWCCGGECEATVIDYEDSPFGFIQGEVVYGQRPDATFLIDLGVHWNKVAAKNGIRFPSKNINDINFDTEVDFTELDKYVKELFVDNGIYMSIPLLTFVKINNEKILLTHDQYRELNTVLIERYNGDGVDDMEGSPKVKYWFVAGSEMNTGIGKGKDINKRKWKLSEADTAESVKIGYDLIKSFDSEFKVLLGGSNSICTWQKDTPCIWREESEPDEFYYNLISEMTGNFFCPDMIFDYHHGSNPTQFKSQIKAMNIVKETLSEFGYANNNIWTTDVGGSWDGLGGFTEIEQSGDVVRRYAYTIANGQEKLYWTRIEEYHWTSDDSSIFDHMGLINNPANADGKYWKKLSYYTYKLMVDKLEGSDWDNIKTIQESDNVYIYKFMKNGDPVWVAWWDYFDDSGSSKIITIDVGDINSVKITEAVPKYETGQEVTDYSTAFNTETKTVSDGQVTITLGESPVFVEKR